MEQILEAIQSGASGDDIGALPIPESYRAAYVQRDEAAMFEGVESWDKDPRKSLHVDEVRTPELAPDEVYIAVMASSINFNTVWTSIFEPLPTFGFLDRLARDSEYGQRHARDEHIVGLRCVGCRSARRCGGSQLEARRPRHGAVQLRRRPGPERAQRLDARFQPEDLGLRDELRCARRPLGREGQPADAQADAPHVGGVGGQRSVQRHVVPHARQRQRCPHEAGRQRPDLGRHRRHRRLRRAVRPQRWWHADRCRVVARARRDPQPDGLRSRHRPQGGELPVLVRRAHSGRVGVATLRQGHPRRQQRRGRRHRVRTSGPLDDGSVGVRRQARAARSSPAQPRRATWSSSTTGTSG